MTPPNARIVFKDPVPEELKRLGELGEVEMSVDGEDAVFTAPNGEFYRMSISSMRRMLVTGKEFEGINDEEE